MSGGPLLFLIAGEPSGDRLGAALIRGLRDATGDKCRFIGIGGPLMEAEGLRSLMPIDRLAVMGLAEVLPRIPELLGLINRAAQAVISAEPAALVTIDSPDFCLRVAKRARRARPGMRTIHYVAPSVWAWRSGRAKKMARTVDHVLALLPFEPPYMTAAGMTCDFVGHPVAAEPLPSAEKRQALREVLSLAPGEVPVVVLPGSRGGEVARHGPMFRQVWDRLSAADPSLRAIVPAVAARVPALQEVFASCARPPLILDPSTVQAPERLKKAAMAEAVAALAVSGTVSLELAAVGTPMVVAYRANPVTAALVRRLVKVRYASLVNILEDAPVIPEYLMGEATTDNLTRAMQALLEDPAARAAQTTRFEASMLALGRGEEPPGLRAARSVLRSVG